MYICVSMRVYVHVRSRDRAKEWERGIQVRRKKEGKRERKRDRSVRPRRWTPRVSPRRCNGKSAAAGVRWTHSLSLARPAAQPSSSTSSSASAYVLRLHMHVHEKGEARGTPIHAGLRRRIITERIVIAFFAMVRNEPVARDGPASQRRGLWGAANGKDEEEDDDDDNEEDVGLLRREAEHAIASSWHKRAMRCSVEAEYLLLGNWVARPRESSVSSRIFFQRHVRETCLRL